MNFLKNHKEVASEEESEGTWAVSYGDMITLLLSFFVIFYNTDFEKEKTLKINHHLGFSIDSLNSSLKGSVDQESGSNDAAKFPEMKNLDIKVHEVGENLVVTFGKISFFNSGQTDIREDAAEVLKVFAEKYIPYAGTYQVSIKGFTDKRPVRKIKRAYKALYRKGLSLEEAKVELVQMQKECSEIVLLTDFLNTTTRGIVR
jgi:flagellar motor protein MotB